MKENAKLLNKQLESKDWLCGTASPTIADYQMAVAMAEQYQCIMEINTVKSLNNFNKFMKKITLLPEFKGRMGSIKPSKKHLLPVFADAAPKAEKEINKKAATKQKK